MEVFKEKVLLVFSVLSGALFLTSFLLIALNVSDFGTPVILHYDAIRGLDLFGEKFDVWAIWLTGVIIAVLNIFLGNVFFYRERILSYLFIIVNFLTALLVLIISGVIVSVN